MHSWGDAQRVTERTGGVRIWVRGHLHSQWGCDRLSDCHQRGHGVHASPGHRHRERGLRMHRLHAHGRGDARERAFRVVCDDSRGALHRLSRAARARGAERLLLQQRVAPRRARGAGKRPAATAARTAPAHENRPAPLPPNH